MFINDEWLREEITEAESIMTCPSWIWHHNHILSYVLYTKECENRQQYEVI